MVVTYYWICYLVVLMFLYVGRVGCRDYIGGALYSDLKHEVDRVRHRQGSDVKLRCSTEQEPEDVSSVIWEFKICEMVTDFEHCDWTEIGHARKKTLEIRNLNRKNSGEYRCSIDGEVKQTFIVEIVSGLYGGIPPRVTNLSATNTTISENSTTILQCRVQSTDPPDIFWFRDCTAQRDRRNCNTVKIDGRDDCYCSLGRARSVPLIGHEYLSKFTIYQSSAADNGLYTCLAWSLHGLDRRNLTIRVLSRSLDNTQLDLSMIWLVLASLLFFLLPMSVWLLCHLRQKKRLVQHNLVVPEQQRRLIEFQLDRRKISQPTRFNC